MAETKVPVQFLPTATRPFTIRFQIGEDVFEVEIDPPTGDETLLDLGELIEFGGIFEEMKIPHDLSPEWITDEDR